MYSWVGPVFHGRDTCIRVADVPPNISIARLISATKHLLTFFVQGESDMDRDPFQLSKSLITKVAGVFHRLQSCRLPTIIANGYEMLGFH